jgi:hypothetical protein
MADPPRLPGGWLPPQPPGPREPEPERPAPLFAPPPREEGTNGLAIAAVVCAVSSLVLLVLSLGLSFAFSFPLGAAGWVCASRAPRDVRPGQRRLGLRLAIAAVALSTIAALVWLVLIAAGVSVADLQQSLQDELDRQRRRGS